ncbi:unnamed protein product [Bathycoccus prasinos]|mmetsp:Transcript_8984/g.28939  ORF Transcript_8984/g.28939 Transcript_8984/m.28939 type:complete len:208 (-) Transcript_8984:2914-3537(-)
MSKEEEKTKEQQKHQLKRLGVETNLHPTSWHGAFSCSVCARKRLPACEFSQAQVKKKRANENASLVCLRCSEREEEETIKTMAGLKMDEENKGSALHECSKCKELKPETEFARSQLRNKGPGKQKCSKCASEADAIANPKGEDVKKLLEEAREQSRKAELTNAPDKLKIFAREAALEAQAVTGLKPKKIGGGRGRGRGGRIGGGRGR